MADTLGNQSVFSVFLSLSSFLPRRHLQKLGPACLAFIYSRDVCDVGPSLPVEDGETITLYLAIPFWPQAFITHHTTSERKRRQVLREKRRARAKQAWLLWRKWEKRGTNGDRVGQKWSLIWEGKWGDSMSHLWCALWDRRAEAQLCLSAHARTQASPVGGCRPSGLRLWPLAGSWDTWVPSQNWAQRSSSLLLLLYPAGLEAREFSSSSSCSPPFLSTSVSPFLCPLLLAPCSLPLPPLLPSPFLFLPSPPHLFSSRHSSTITWRKDPEVCLLCVTPSIRFIDTYLNLLFIIS